MVMRWDEKVRKIIKVLYLPSKVTYIWLNTPPRPYATAGPNIDRPVMIPKEKTQQILGPAFSHEVIRNVYTKDSVSKEYVKYPFLFVSIKV